MRIYYSNIHEIISEAESSGKVPEWLTEKADPERLAKASRIKPIPEKVRSLAAGALIYRAFADYVSAEGLSGDIVPEYDYSKNGKPMIKGFPDFHFSVSHSGDYVALVTADAPVGIDVQEERAMTDYARLAERFFSNKEKEILLGLEDADESIHMFYRMWAAKESYVKMTGMGLYEDLGSFTFLPGKLEIHRGEPEQTAGFIFEPLPILGNVLEICFGKREEDTKLCEVLF